MSLLFGLYIGSGSLLVILSLPLLWEKIPPNPIYGFRVPATLEDEKLWYAVNKYAARRLMAAGLSIVIAAFLLRYIPGLSLDAYALACLAVFLLALGFGLFQSLRYMKSISK
jgi:uncharacterized membrane protein